MHLEFVVLGIPISNQSRSSSLLATWRTTVESQARIGWTRPPLAGNLKGIIINFHEGNKPSLDVDNMSKPIFDVMEGIVYANDRQIRQAEITHLRIGDPFVIRGVSKLLVAALQAGSDFVYVRIEDAVSPFPLPR